MRSHIPPSRLKDERSLSYDVAIIRWITSCHKNRMSTGAITLAHTRNVIDNVHVNNEFSSRNSVRLRAIKFHFKRSYDKQDLTLVVISYEISETRQRLVP